MTDETKPAKIGRPTKLTPELSKAICEKVAEGLPLHVAAGLNRVTRQTIHNWLAEGEADDAPEELRDFFDNLTRAKAAAQADMISDARRLAEPTDRALNPGKPEVAIALLKVLYPKDYSDKTNVEHSGKIEVTSPVIMVPPDADD